jgi:hypothetical protein
MLTSIFRILTAAAVMGIVLSPGAASAAALRPTALTYSSSSTPSGGDPDTTVTFTVTVGALGMTAPTAANLGGGAPGTTISGSLGSVAVTDNRALLAAAWTATASSTDWVTGTGTASETIPAGDVTYVPGGISTTGVITATGTTIFLSGAATPVVTATAGVGDNTASWNPTLVAQVPAAAVGGVYTATVIDSVS